MREGRAARAARRDREFDAFVAGAGGRLLRTAQLLTCDAAAAERLLTLALASTYAAWDRLGGDDPYALARQELVARFARFSWRHRRARGGVLDRLTPRERLVVVLRLHEGVAEEQAAAGLGLPPERVRAVCARAVAALRERPRDTG
ncbi:RNA polymerase [Streptomyces sp. AV19]|uniref:sigma factor-like helix-turn-helix DNA-binding protein n=1 Tax=Streptomyces sp. AV19 TaxID=2793068 RepID=UPI0018FEE02D|nr:sigma factor-like helix-turn-helix DNA-binding protein [Streptomyces sp. AV19]MBH1935516.1 RNA polymerase [Streptomyces sp. AV19]MDG4534404.1 RNA polymerase [Streptomyces sp. AV19]